MKRFLWILLLIVLALSACDGSDRSDVTTQAPQLSDEVQTFDDNSSSSYCPYDVAQIKKELANLSNIAATPYVSGLINLSFKLGEKMLAAQRVLNDPNCTQEATQFKIRETLQLANLADVMLGAEICYNGASIAQGSEYTNRVNQCRSDFETEFNKVCRNSGYDQQWCESVKAGHLR